MPPGSLKYQLEPFSCDGFDKVKTWTLSYRFEGGKRNGVKYNGDSRFCYLPDTPDGREVLALLIKAFKRKLTFTIGHSVVRGKDNCIVWAIHHKTNTHGGSSHYGFPDPTYFNRVKNELADKGVLIEDVKEISDAVQSTTGIVIKSK